MKTLSVLFFALVFIFVIQPDFRQNSVFAQSKPVCVYCGCDLPNGVHKNINNCPYYKEAKSNESNSSINLSSENEIKLTLIQAAINLIFGNKEIDNKEKERQLKEKQIELERIAAENEKQRQLQEKIAQELHNNLMALTKKLPDSKDLEEKKLSESFDDKSFDGNNKDLGFKEIDVSKNDELPIKTGEEVNKDFFGSKVIDEKELENLEVESLVKLEQIKYETNFDDWVKDNNGDVLLRLKESDPYLVAVTNSIKTKTPPPLDPYSEPGTKVKDLQPGDVLLVGNKFAHPITILDKLFSGTLKTNASHTLLYLKEIGGQKMFLDIQPEIFGGERIITETQFYTEYGKRPMEVASLIGKPTNHDNGDKLYNAAFELIGENEQYKYENPWSIFTGTKYGLQGDDMVCSEADKWVLRKANFIFPNTEDKIKKIFGLDFSPADYSKSGYFFIRPLKLKSEEDN